MNKIQTVALTVLLMTPITIKHGCSNYQRGLEYGHAEATSNLVSAIQTIGKTSRDKLTYQSQLVERNIPNRHPANSEILIGYTLGKCHIQMFEEILVKNAKQLAEGKDIKTISSYKCFEQNLKETPMGVYR